MSAQHGSWILGNVTFDFSVGVDGQVTNINVLGGISNCLYVELYELLSKMPKWSPEMKNGEAVAYPFAMLYQCDLLISKKAMKMINQQTVCLERS